MTRCRCFVKSSLHSSSEACYTVQLLPPVPSPSPHISPTPSIFNSIPMLFSCQMPWPIAFLNFAPTTFALYFPPIILLIVCFLFFLMFFTIFLWQLPNFFWVITRPFFPMSKACIASITSNIISPKHFQHLTPSTFPTLFLLNFF